eukprot:4137085-Alexandrium_andersonii.AAC.1
MTPFGQSPFEQLGPFQTSAQAVARTRSGLALSLASLHRTGPKVQSAIRARPDNAAIRLNPQSAM